MKTDGEFRSPLPALLPVFLPDLRGKAQSSQPFPYFLRSRYCLFPYLLQWQQSNSFNEGDELEGKNYGPPVLRRDLCHRQGKWHVQASFPSQISSEEEVRNATPLPSQEFWMGGREALLLSLAPGKVLRNRKNGAGGFPSWYSCKPWVGAVTSDIVNRFCLRDTTHFTCMKEWKPFMCMLIKILNSKQLS